LPFCPMTSGALSGPLHPEWSLRIRFHTCLADLADCENECFPFSWLIFAHICSLI
uniref:Uncharacterized protein n=1 Tax=Gopherus agassizii TaxID=38772 RepID=A0A452IA60_9SAUR